jgi:hypothetical protein
MADKGLNEAGSGTKVMGEQGLTDASLDRHDPHGTLLEPVLDNATLESFEDFRLPFS